MLEVGSLILIYLTKKTQIIALQANKAPIKILDKFSNYMNIFFLDLATKLFKNTSMNEYAIKLINKKQLLYKLIYILSLVELKILKAYIKTYTKTGFILTFKFFAGTPILFDKKLDSIFYLCVNY